MGNVMSWYQQYANYETNNTDRETNKEQLEQLLSQIQLETQNLSNIKAEIQDIHEKMSQQQFNIRHSHESVSHKIDLIQSQIQSIATQMETNSKVEHYRIDDLIENLKRKIPPPDLPTTLPATLPLDIESPTPESQEPLESSTNIISLSESEDNQNVKPNNRRIQTISDIDAEADDEFDEDAPESKMVFDLSINKKPPNKKTSQVYNKLWFNFRKV